MNTKYISGNEAFFDDDRELYYCYVGEDNGVKTLSLLVYGNTPTLAKQKAAALCNILNGHTEINQPMLQALRAIRNANLVPDESAIGKLIIDTLKKYSLT